MLLALLASLMGGPPLAGCIIKGDVELIRDGKGVDPHELVVVYIKAKKKLSAQTRPRTHIMRQHNDTFVPRVLVVMVGDTVEFINEDSREHSVYSYDDFETFDFPKNAKGRTGERSFMLTGPLMVQCEIHGQMRSEVLVLNTDRWAQPDAQGHYQLPELPRGDYEVVFWEPNGTTVNRKVQQCDGQHTVAKVSLTEGPPPPRPDKTGTNRPPVY